MTGILFVDSRRPRPRAAARGVCDPGHTTSAITNVLTYVFVALLNERQVPEIGRLGRVR